ncbi:hypothetical protein FEM48_Zijuj11G0146400 [Ziziphus jujuba var. spinosa]|uniref:Uncharacterized protein n=1 Tax=Ziziphus jujuba var. spinosa TaxID=714518 RepID=A0A978UJI6_ZIZJJ|nr:hypothetical protein FEM48_Zijuj11G0146400 [Ziziphus jujuba var. spinosa]
MVLWEITLGTAYFLGLKRTYRLALRIQRRLISPKHSRVRQFVHGYFFILFFFFFFFMFFACFLDGIDLRTRAVFDVALKVHRNIQERDIEVGRNLGNWILRWLDRMKPSAQIRVHPPGKPPNASSSISRTKQATNNSSQLKRNGSIHTSRNRESDRHLFTSSKSLWNSKPFPTISMMTRPPKPAAGTMTQYRHLFTNGPETVRTLNHPGGGFRGVVIRNDIRQWMLQN